MQPMDHPPLPACDDPSWRALEARDPQAAFFYGVTTTGVVCRPDCPSRRPHREHVVCFLNLELALLAGFRPCRRCHPADDSHRGSHLRLVLRTCSFLDTAPAPVTLARTAAEVGCSRFHLLRVFKEVTGITPRAYQAARRAGAARHQLARATTVTVAIQEAGYGSERSFYEGVEPRLGMLPATYRRGGQGARIGHVVTPTALGPLLVAATNSGLCAVEFLGGATASMRLGELFPRAELVDPQPGLDLLAAELRARVEGKSASGSLPLDVVATTFQALVWDELRKIPPGQTRSYSDVARAIGRAGSSRAVGGACAANPVAMAIPCHRVTAGNGGLGGYRWGLECKAALLRAESRVAGPGSQTDSPASRRA